MAYLGNRPAESYASFETETFSVSATASYTLSHAVTNENEIRLVINGVVQQPGSGKAYTASGTTLTLTSATVSGDVMYAVYLGRALQTVNPPNASVGSAQIADSLISGKTALSATPADTDELLISDAGTLKRVDFSHLKVSNTPSFCAYRDYSNGGYQSIPNNTFTKCAFNAEYWDTAGEFDPSTNYRWTAATAGKYVIGTNIVIDNLADGASLLVSIYKNGSAVGTNAQGLNGITSSGNGNPDQCQLVSTKDVAANDYFEVFVKHQHRSSRDWRTEYGNVFYAHKLIGV